MAAFGGVPALEVVKLTRQRLAAQAVQAKADGTDDYPQLLKMEANMESREKELSMALDAARSTGPVRQVLARMKALRYPHEERGRSLPDFDRVFQPSPYRPEVSVPSVPGFWEDLVRVVTEACSAIPEDPKFPWIPPGRLPLLYMVSSFGRGKTLVLREAARYLYKNVDAGALVPETKHVGGTMSNDDPEVVVQAQPSRMVAGRGVVVLAVNFNGSYRVDILERIGLSSRPDEAEFNYYLLLYVRILFNELVDLSDPRTSPAGVFKSFLKNFYGDYKAQRFNLEDVYKEVTALVESRAGRGSDKDVVALLVDEIGKLRTGVGGQICADNVLDLRFPIRSEACSVVEAGSGLGVAYFVAMESSLMLSERSASGRAAEPLMSLPPGDLSAQKIRLLDAMRASAAAGTGASPVASPAVNTAMWRLQVDTQTKIFIEHLHVAEVYALLGGMLWRSVELFVEKLLVVPEANLVKVLMEVDSRLVTDSMGDDLSYSSFWEHRNAVFRDNVLAAALLPVDVVEEDLVIPSDGMMARRDAASGAVADFSKPSREEILELRTALAREAYLRFQKRKHADLTWGDALSLGFLMADRGSSFRPSVIPISLLRALAEDDTPSSSSLWMALRAIVQVVVTTKSGQYDRNGKQLEETKFGWCCWELFMLHWEVLVSAARALRTDHWASVTYSYLYGRKAAFKGSSKLLSNVHVDATVERTGVVYLAGAGASTGGWTINDLLGGKVPENIMCQTMFKLPQSAPAVDGVGFRRALDDVPGVVSRGELIAEWYQKKHSKPTAATVLSADDVKKSLDNMGWVGKDAAATQFYGGQQGYVSWGRRSVFVYAGLRKVSVKAVNHPLAANAFVLDESDLNAINERPVNDGSVYTAINSWPCKTEAP
ncbi:hypothetical protein I4F81_002547 [Pyropia yezoensis]|uniref:Uncharacterized protein n=1 Tax=Pyropia yezoensis TaxID=2788 RepID=A0ACC3BQD6_PYRYE|nr:hypothetical protein I4F81_002547 [Neopyropia yezoensis]